MATTLYYDEANDEWISDDPSYDDEPPYGSFPDETGEVDLIGTPYSDALIELSYRYDADNEGIHDPFDIEADWLELA